MKTYGTWTIALALTLVPLIPGCSDDEDDAGDERGDVSNDSGNASNAGNSSGNGSGGGSAANDDDDDDCESRVCLFSADSAFGFCSKVCDSWSDCPSFWECVEVGNATRTYCAPS